MKTTTLIEVDTCDICKKTERYGCYGCMSCGKDICFNCREGHGVTYAHSVHFGGSLDGFYCLECNSKNLSSGTDELFNQYQDIRKLRDEYKTWWVDYEKRAKLSNETLERLLKQLKQLKKSKN